MSDAAPQPEQPARDGDLIARLKVAARALIRERKCYAEDVETLVDAVRALEAIATQPPQQAEGGAVAWMTPGGDVSRSYLWCTERTQEGQSLTPLYTHPPKSPIVSEDQFDAASDAYQDVFDGDNHRSALKHALTAALRGGEPLCPVPISEPRDRLSRDDCIMRGECGCTVAGEEIRSLRSRAEAAEQQAVRKQVAGASGEAVAWLYLFPHDGETDHALSLTPFLDSWVNAKGATATPLYALGPIAGPFSVMVTA